MIVSLLNLTPITTFSEMNRNYLRRYRFGLPLPKAPRCRWKKCYVCWIFVVSGLSGGILSLFASTVSAGGCVFCEPISDVLGSAFARCGASPWSALSAPSWPGAALSKGNTINYALQQNVSFSSDKRRKIRWKKKTGGSPAEGISVRISGGVLNSEDSKKC